MRTVSFLGPADGKSGAGSTENIGEAACSLADGRNVGATISFGGWLCGWRMSVGSRNVSRSFAFASGDRTGLTVCTSMRVVSFFGSFGPVISNECDYLRKARPCHALDF